MATVHGSITRFQKRARIHKERERERDRYARGRSGFRAVSAGSPVTQVAGVGQIRQPSTRSVPFRLLTTLAV